jgi:hypothetical protein
MCLSMRVSNACGTQSQHFRVNHGGKSVPPCGKYGNLWMTEDRRAAQSCPTEQSMGESGLDKSRTGSAWGL